MTRSSAKASIAIALSAQVCGCLLNDTYDTVEEAAVEIASVFCFRGEECGDLDAGADVQACIDILVDLICLEEDCSLEPAASDAEINECVDDLGAAECDAQATPVSCDGILIGF